MILSDLKNYLKEHKRVALVDLANRFSMEPDALRGMLGKWINKGKVRKLDSGTRCGDGCCQCDPAQIELYEWVD
jgi:putative ferrous iron transport protein C